MRFKENLRSIRKRNRISQEELAAYLGVSQRTVSHYERGDCEPNMTYLCKLACYFNITLDELIGYNKEDWM
ncbi:MAG: helix-turn-helix transcriptional regulator [Clostridia bacterium]|jgi:transcriptional regulator with XRE-family HTH domain|nr:helix-turn-helix transcriptional regulator [Clostridia bacterium]MCX4366760.1 helix-turn-helix transcriptional regulator [Clostridia bacterium]